MGFGTGTLVFAYHLSPYPVVLIGRYTVNSVIACNCCRSFGFFSDRRCFGKCFNASYMGSTFLCLSNGYNTTSMQVKQHSNAYPQNRSLYSKSLIYIIG